MAGSIFISYGHIDVRDVPWVERLRPYLMQNLHQAGVEIWDDSKIDTGSDWQESIKAALNSASAAILLVGPGFLGSEFIRTKELPYLISETHRRRIPVFPLIVGYCAYRTSVLASVQAFNDPDQPVEGLPRAEQNRIMNNLAIAINERIERRVLDNRSRPGTNTDVSAARAIRKHLADSEVAFDAQLRLREKLEKAIEERTEETNTLEYERFFFKHFNRLTALERFEFDQIRAITEGALQRANRSIVELLESHAGLLDEIPILVDLRQHLVFWLNKYDLVFARRPEMCVLYVGVEDAVPFPNGVEGMLDQWLARKAG